MSYKNLAELKEQNALSGSSAVLKSVYAGIRLSMLYDLLYTNAEHRLDLLAGRIRELYPDIPEEHIKTSMTLGGILEILRNNPYELSSNPYLRTSNPKYDLYLSVIFELIFLPLYIVR